MTDLLSIITQHSEKYPKMQPCDAVKLIYQNEFGGEHLLGDFQSCFESIKNELDSIQKKDTAELSCDIGEDLSRLNLIPDTISAFLYTKIFCASAEIFEKNNPRNNTELSSKNSPLVTGDKNESFRLKLNILRSAVEESFFEFSAIEFNEFLAKYSSQNYPSLSHSSIYKNEYSPHYRIVLSEYCRLFNVISKLEKQIEKDGRAVIAIEGYAASGKSYITGLLSRIFECSVIETDDFFLPGILRVPKRFNTPGGNIHFERFIEEVINPLETKKDFKYKIFDCKLGDYNGYREVLNKPLIIVEGSYSLHPAFGEYYTTSVFMQIDPDLQRHRILERDGNFMLERFLHEWIPLEKEYFSKCKIPQRCEFIL